MAKVFIGVDPHKLSATIEVVDDRETLLATGRFDADKAGYAAMRKHVRAWPERVWAVEGSNGAGRPLAQRLLADGEHVVDVPAKLSARARLFDIGHNRKTDAHDAHAVAVRTQGLRVLSYDEGLEALRMLTDRRDELSRQRVQTVNRLHRLLSELTPGRSKKDLTALQAKALLASVRPRDLGGKTRRRLAAEQLTELAAVDKKIKELTKELKVMVISSGSDLMNLRGVGPVVAARTLADVGDVARFADRNRFASWTGTAPLEASSGEIVRHRLSRAGNRKMNHMIHIAAATQIRLDTPGRAYYRRKLAAGKTRAEAMRCLKRRISDALFRQLVARSARGWNGPGRALRGDSDIQRGRPAPAHRHFGSATSRTRTHDATGRHGACAPPCGLGSPDRASTRRSRQGAAPHRTNDLDGDKRRCTLQSADPDPLTTEGCLLVVGLGAGGAAHRGERPLLRGIAQSFVARVAGHHDLLGAGGLGDRCCPGVGLASLGIDIPAGVIAELAEHPGGQDGTQARQAGEDLSVRVLAKMLGHHLLEGVDLGVQGGDQSDLRTHRGRVGRLDRSRLAQLLRPKHRHGLVGAFLGVASPRPDQRRQDRATGQSRRRVRVGGLTQELQRVGGVKLGKRLQRSGKELPQRRAQPQHIRCRRCLGRPVRAGPRRRARYG